MRLLPVLLLAASLLACAEPTPDVDAPTSDGPPDSAASTIDGPQTDGDPSVTCAGAAPGTECPTACVGQTTFTCGDACCGDDTFGLSCYECATVDGGGHAWRQIFVDCACEGVPDAAP